MRVAPLLIALCLMTGLAAQAHVVPGEPGRHWEVVTTQALRDLRERNPDLILVNVLPRIIHDQWHIPGSLNIPLGAIAARSAELPADKEARVVFYCMGRLCMYSAKAADLAHEMGYNRLLVYRAGLLGWLRAGLPVASSATYPEVEVPLISARRLASDSDAYLLDLRPADHFARGHVAGSVNIDLEVLHERIGDLPRDRQIVLIDHKGKLTLTTGRYLASQGVTGVSRLDGGFNAWVKTGLPVAQARARPAPAQHAEADGP
jgi:rhodanese-related sulfurtransferase